MSDKKTDKPKQVEEQEKQPAKPVTEDKSAHVADTQPAKRSGNSTAPVIVAAVIVLAVVGGAFWYVYDGQQKFKHEVEQQLQTQLGSVRQSTQQMDSLSQQLNRSQSELKRAQERVALLEEQVGDLSQALQIMTDSGTELMLLNDVAHFIDLAQQQLLVGGNVSNAIIPLETAQARLVRSDRQGLAILLQAINGDLDRLRAVEKLDMPATLKQLETLHTWLAEAPLLTPQNEDLELFHPHNTASGTSRSNEDSADQEW